MFLFELLIALCVAFILSLILFGVGWERPYREGTWGGLVAWFVILLLAVWVGGIWLTPFGPRLRDIAWVPFVITGVFLLLFLFIVAPAPRPWRRPRTRREALEQVDMAREEEAVRASAFGCLFWLLLVLLIAALFSRYTIYPRPLPPLAVSSLEQGNEIMAVRPAAPRFEITPSPLPSQERRIDVNRSHTLWVTRGPGRRDTMSTWELHS